VTFPTFKPPRFAIVAIGAVKESVGGEMIQQSAFMGIKAQGLCLAALAVVGIIVGVVLAIVTACQGAWLSSAISGSLSVAAVLLAVRCYGWAHSV
jgi:hypothetical protein